MPNYKFPILLTLSIALSIISCWNKTKKLDTSPEDNNAKNIILRINSEQQKLYQQFSTKEKRAEKYKEFCHDSLITITGYGNFLYNSVEAGNDLVDGYADTIHDIHLKIYGNTAILTGKAKMFVLIKNDTLYEDIWISKVFINSNGKWKMVLRNSGPSGINYHKSIFVKEKTLLKYQGEYGLSGDHTDTYRVDNGRLYWVGANNLKVLYYALNDSTFFAKDDPGFLVFRSNLHGAIDHIDFTLPDGQIIEIPKVEQ